MTPATLHWDRHNDRTGHWISARFAGHSFQIGRSRNSDRYELLTIYPTGRGAVSFYDHEHQAQKAATVIAQRVKV